MRIPEISLLDHLPGYIGWKDLNHHYVGANKALLELKGFRDVEELAGKTDEELSPWAICYKVTLIIMMLIFHRINTVIEAMLNKVLFYKLTRII
ncbi:TPA: hypothetical protein ACJXEA_000027 [Legionella pneumophila subsp. fraseri]